jgi:predicted exporter
LKPVALKQVKASAVLWLLFFCACLYIVVSRFSTTVDLSYFLPNAGNAEQQVLIDRLGQGAGSRLWFIVLPPGFAEEPILASNQFAGMLRDSGLFRSVLNGQESVAGESIPAVIFANRYLLTDQDFSPSGFANAVQDLLPDLLLAPDSATEEWLTADPYLAAVDVLEQVAATIVPDSLTWVAADGTAYLLAESIAPAYEVGAQLEILALVRSVAQQHFAAVPETYGVGAYGAMLQQTIEAEARLRTLLASFAIIVVLLLVYRRPVLVLISAVPLVLGAVAALAAVTAVFGTLHGITLAFGFTLFGVAIDFPLHIFSHSRGGRSALPKIWPTLRLGAMSTVLAYCAVAAAGSLGLAQLGLFSAVGVAVALLASVSLVPALLKVFDDRDKTAESAVIETYSLSHRVWLPALVLALGVLGLVVFGQSRAIWSDDLSALTPLPTATIARDRALRQQFGAPDIRYLILLQAADKEQVLQQTERLATDLRTGNLVAGVQAVTDLVPSAQRQGERRRAAELFSRDSAVVAAEEFGLVDNAFAAFAAAIEALRTDQPDITELTYSATAFAASVQSGLYQQNGVWFSVLLPGQVTSISALHDYLRSAPADATLVDLKAASLGLVSDYRLRILLMLAVAGCLIVLLLGICLGVGARLYWVLGGLLTTFLVTLCINLLLFAAISLFNLIALVLVAGLGLDYLLFSSRTTDVNSSASDYADSRHAITASMLSTAAAFAVLALSEVPILAGLGTTVLSGVLVAYVIASLGVRRNP